MCRLPPVERVIQRAHRAQHTSRSRYRNELPQGMSMSEQRKIGGGLVEQELLGHILSMHLRRLGADEVFS